MTTLEEKYEQWKKDNPHDQPSRDTLKFMQKMELEIEHIKDKLCEMPTKDEMLLANSKLVNDIFEKAEKKFASKLTEKIVYAMLGAILLYFLSKVLCLL